MATTSSGVRGGSLLGVALPAEGLWFAALLSLGASGVHFAVAPEHFEEYWVFGWFFVVAAWLQALWAVALVGLGASKRLLLAGIIGNTALVALWFWTRVIGVPLGPDSGETEAFAWVDGVAVACEVGVVILAGIALREGGQVGANRWTIAFVAGLSILLIAVVGTVLEDSDGSHQDEDARMDEHAGGEARE